MHLRHFPLLASVVLAGAACGPRPIPDDPNLPQALDCVSTDWSEWSECSLPCGGGERARTREIEVPAANGGAACGPLDEVEACNTMACPITPEELRVAVLDQATVTRLTSQEWLIVSETGTTHLLDELSRDEWSIYLLWRQEPSITFQLDLFQDSVLVRRDGGLIESLPILEKNPERLDGLATTHVTYGGGAFVQITTDKWFEHNGDGIHVWAADGRDERSIRLRNDARSVTMRLDMQTMEAHYAGREGSWVLYQLDDSQPSTIDGHLMREVLYDGGRFVKVDHGRWLEQNDTGTYSFVEYGRDPWSVYLSDASRDVRVQLDLYTRRIQATWGDGPTELLYTVTGAN